MPIRSFYVLGVATLMSCASAATTPGTRRDSNLITEQEIVASTGTTAYDVIVQLRPTFLKSRGRSSINPAVPEDYATVFLDGQAYGDLNSLRNIPAIQIHQIRYIRGTDAAATFGMQYASGIIDVRSR